MWFQSETPELAGTMASVMPGYWFHCPDVAAIDESLTELLRWVGPRSGLTDARKLVARQDMDRLLDLRAALMAEAAGIEPAQV